MSGGMWLGAWKRCGHSCRAVLGGLTEGSYVWVSPPQCTHSDTPWSPAHRWGSGLSKIARNSERCFTKSAAKEEKAGKFESARMSRQARSDSQSTAGFSVITWTEPPDRR